MKVVFFCSSRYVIPVLEMLHNNFDLPLVVTTEQNKMDPVPFYCNSKKIEYITVRKSADLISNYQIEQSMALVGVVADFGLLIPERVISAFSYGILNIHPSLLPKYRGPSPVQNAILNGDAQTGVSIIKLDKYVDHGPILAQIEEKIKPNDTAKTLYERLFKLSARLLEKALVKLENSQAHFSPQDQESATFTKPLAKDDGYYDLKSIPGSKDFFERMVRAYYPWPGVWIKASVNENEQVKMVKFLPDKKIQVEGGNEMSYKDFLNGYPNADKNLIELLKEGL